MKNEMLFEAVINKQSISVEVPSDATLLYVLREVLHMMGTKEGCGEGDCGACTILLNNRSVKSCTVLAAQAIGKEIMTIEGIQNSKWHRIPEVFVKYGAVQCGFCSPGVIMATVELLNRIPNPTEEEIRRGLSGNLCRCTGYQAMIDAVTYLAAHPEDERH